MNDPHDPHDASRWDAVEEATELLREGDTDGALESLRTVLRSDPANAYAHKILGDTHFERGEFKLACGAYASAVHHAPAYLGAIVALGHALRMAGELDAAVRTGEQALRLHTDDPDAHHLMGLAHAARGDARAAVKHLEAFVASGPEIEAKSEAQAMIDVLRGKATPLESV